MYVVDGVGRVTYPSNYINDLWSGQTLKRGDKSDYVKTLQSWLYSKRQIAPTFLKAEA